MHGRVELLRVPKWSDSSCQTVSFPPYRFYPDTPVHVQITVNHMNLNDSATVHDAITSWTENINTKNFTVCAMQSGRKSKNFNPFATVDWMAYQGAPPEGMTGEIKIQNWWSGTNCADVNLPKVGYSCHFAIFLCQRFFVKKNFQKLKKNPDVKFSFDLKFHVEFRHFHLRTERANS